MTYELAKKLKEAGFPQYGKNREVDGGLAMTNESGTLEGCYIPTLSELIEACGEDFWALYKVGTRETPDWKWEAGSFGVPLNEIVGKGQTPEEAVANLWLKLNEHRE